MKARYVILIALIALAVGLFCGGYVFPGKGAPVETIVRDTVVVRDTIRLEVPKPVRVYITRYDTVKVSTPNDTVDSGATGLELAPSGQVVVTVEQKTYTTPDYTAVVEGWRPKLVSMEVYPKTVTIRETVTRLKAPRWAVTVGPGLGYDGSKIRPHVGVTVGWVLWSK